MKLKELCSGTMNSNCSFLKITGERCGRDTEDRSRSVDCVPLLSCNKDIRAYKSAFALSDVEIEVDLILSSGSIFSTPANVTQLLICVTHRGQLRYFWKRTFIFHSQLWGVPVK